MLTAEETRELLNYDPETGWLTWRFTRCSKAIGGERAGCEVKKKNGYSNRQIRIHYKLYSEHVVIWLIVTGHWPTKEIDHKNHNATDNRWENLREATKIENGRNQKLSSNNSTGINGIIWDKRRSKFRAEIMVNHKHIYLGRFNTLEDAAAARREADIKYGFHENHGK